MSLILPSADYDIAMSDLDLTTSYSTNNQWSCTITLDESASPEYEQVYCTKTVASQNDFSTLAVKYQARVVVNAIGYRYLGPDSGYAEWVFGGQVTLDMEASAMAGLSSALAALLAAGFVSLY